MMAHAATANTHSPDHPTISAAHSNNSTYNNKVTDLATFEEYELKEMEWLSDRAALFGRAQY
jgi:hypothetical protein